jgi:CspA family cold shock protein
MKIRGAGVLFSLLAVAGALAACGGGTDRAAAFEKNATTVCKTLSTSLGSLDLPESDATDAWQSKVDDQVRDARAEIAAIDASGNATAMQSQLLDGIDAFLDGDESGAPTVAAASKTFPRCFDSGMQASTAEPTRGGSGKGSVVYFNETKGYGFIRTSGGKDVFVHISAVRRAGLTTLSPGQQVAYEEVANNGKTSAENLSVVPD